jgi:RNA polymerase sigma-70 factor (ECF subfamily)
MDQQAFLSLVRRVRAGDDRAATELVRVCAPALQRLIRLQLTDPRLRRVLDTMDVCQSVLGKFFLHVIAGEFDLESPHQLSALLATMARNRILKHVHREQAARRDMRRLHPDSSVLENLADTAGNPSQAVANAELLQRVLAELSPEERALIEQRAAEVPWEEIAAERGESAEALRKRLRRAIDRVAGLFGLEEQEHG